MALSSERVDVFENFIERAVGPEALQKIHQASHIAAGGNDLRRQNWEKYESGYTDALERQVWPPDRSSIFWKEIERLYNEDMKDGTISEGFNSKLRDIRETLNRELGAGLEKGQLTKALETVRVGLTSVAPVTPVGGNILAEPATILHAKAGGFSDGEVRRLGRAKDQLDTFLVTIFPGEEPGPIDSRMQGQAIGNGEAWGRRIPESQERYQQYVHPGTFASLRDQMIPENVRNQGPAAISTHIRTSSPFWAEVRNAYQRDMRDGALSPELRSVLRETSQALGLTSNQLLDGMQPGKVRSRTRDRDPESDIAAGRIRANVSQDRLAVATQGLQDDVYEAIREKRMHPLELTADHFKPEFLGAIRANPGQINNAARALSLHFSQDLGIGGVNIRALTTNLEGIIRTPKPPAPEIRIISPRTPQNTDMIKTIFDGRANAAPILEAHSIIAARNISGYPQQITRAFQDVKDYGNSAGQYQAMTLIGQHLLGDKKTMADGVKLLKASAEAGNADAVLTLAEMMYKGQYNGIDTTAHLAQDQPSAARMVRGLEVSLPHRFHVAAQRDLQVGEPEVDAAYRLGRLRTDVQASKDPAVQAELAGGVDALRAPELAGMGAYVTQKSAAAITTNI